MTEIECPRAKSYMTPCVARDGALAVSDAPGAVCVGCGHDPWKLQADLAERYEPAKLPKGKPHLDRRVEADRFHDLVVAYVESRPASDDLARERVEAEVEDKLRAHREPDGTYACDPHVIVGYVLDAIKRETRF